MPQSALDFIQNPILHRSQPKPSKGEWLVWWLGRERKQASTSVSPLPGTWVPPTKISPCQADSKNIDMFLNLKFSSSILPNAKFPPIFPSILLAVGNRTVNYISLDIEGAELQVLKYTISCPVIVVSKSKFIQQNMFLTYFDVFSLFRY